MNEQPCFLGCPQGNARQLNYVAPHGLRSARLCLPPWSPASGLSSPVAALFGAMAEPTAAADDGVRILEQATAQSAAESPAVSGGPLSESSSPSHGRHSIGSSASTAPSLLSPPSSGKRSTTSEEGIWCPHKVRRVAQATLNKATRIVVDSLPMHEELTASNLLLYFFSPARPPPRLVRMHPKLHKSRANYEVTNNHGNTCKHKRQTKKHYTLYSHHNTCMGSVATLSSIVCTHFQAHCNRRHSTRRTPFPRVLHLLQ
jgi:hypothetical protein